MAFEISLSVNVSVNVGIKELLVAGRT